MLPVGAREMDPEVLARGVIGVGFDGADPSTAPLDALRAFGPGGIILFGRNVADGGALRALIAALRESTVGTPLPLTIVRAGRTHDVIAILGERATETQ